MSSRLRCAIPLAAGPVVVAAHLCSEALVSGRSPLALMHEPLHGYLFLLAFVSTPLWIVASRRGYLRFALLAFVALTLGLEGNGLGVAALAMALAVGALFGWLGGVVIERAASDSRATALETIRRNLEPALRVPVPALEGPYYAFVPIRGNRPPPQLL